MTYDLNSVKDYVQQVVDQYKIKFNDLPYQKNMTSWEEHEQWLDNLKDHLKSERKNPMFVVMYAQAISQTIGYLQSKSPIPTSRANFINEKHVDALIGAANTVFPRNNFTEPESAQKTIIHGRGKFVEKTKLFQHKIGQDQQEEYDTVFGAKKIVQNGFKAIVGGHKIPKREKVEPAVKAFLNSNLFRGLESYQKLLGNDKRSHTYFCGLLDLTEKQKAKELRIFVDTLKKQATMEEIRWELKEFYEGKGCTIPEKSGLDKRSPFDILNAGQNIASRLLSLFGFRATTTIGLIDKLAESIGFDTHVELQLQAAEENSTRKSRNYY